MLQEWVCRMCVCPQRLQIALNKSWPDDWHPRQMKLSMSDKNNRDWLGKDHPSVPSRCLSSSWDYFVSLETKACEKERWDGCCLDEWVGSHQARSCRVQTKSSPTTGPPRLNMPLSPQLSIAHSLKMTLPSFFFLLLCLFFMLLSFFLSLVCVFPLNLQ